MKQSSIDWLIHQLTEVDHSCINKTFLQSNNTIAGYEMRKLFEQAKAMHKLEIMNAHGEEQSYLEDDGSWTRQTAEQYYNETFNTNQENLPDSTNGYTYYPLEHKTIFNTEEK